IKIQKFVLKNVKISILLILIIISNNLKKIYISLSSHSSKMTPLLNHFLSLVFLNLFLPHALNNINAVHCSLCFLSVSSGIHILQSISGCEWNESTGEMINFLRYAYNGEDFLEFDMKTLTWIAPKPEAVITKQRWDTDENRIKYTVKFLSRTCPMWLKMSLESGKRSLQRTVLPSVSLLQKSSSSPVSCHATGFYPQRVEMFWRKDGEEIHDGVDPGEILPNNDETFQMNVDLNVSSVRPEDWRGTAVTVGKMNVLIVLIIMYYNHFLSFIVNINCCCYYY
uniref:Ig-like domain-containing protein n=1 Tax=Oreochromis aureus TaxID=47969 RepID=A0A668S8N3_OREAU